MNEREKRTQDVDSVGHLVQLLGADIGAVGKAEVNKAPFPYQVAVRERLVVVRLELERPANVRPAKRARLPLLLCTVRRIHIADIRKMHYRRTSLLFQAFFFPLKVEIQPGTCGNEQQRRDGCEDLPHIGFSVHTTKRSSVPRTPTAALFLLMSS
jgi:hypothetical protein